MRIKARVTQIWAYCVPAVVSVIGDGTVLWLGSAGGVLAARGRGGLIRYLVEW